LPGSKVWLELSEDGRVLARRLVAALGYEPYPMFFDGAAAVLETLMAKGLVQAGPSLRPAVGAIGYRLTDKGWDLVSANWAFGAVAQGEAPAPSEIQPPEEILLGADGLLALHLRA
jgi:hypothetical protein